MMKTLKLTTFISLLLITNVALAQSLKQKSNALSPTFIAIIVSDMDSSIAWYKNKLGFELMNRTVNKERGFQQATLQTAEANMELLEINGALNPTDSINQPLIGFFKFGFSTTHFDWWIEHLEQQSANFHGRVVPDPHTGKRMVIVKDPDGNRIQIFEQ